MAALQLLLLDFLPMTAASALMSAISKSVDVPSAPFNAARFMLLGLAVAVVALCHPPARPRMSDAQWLAAAACGALMFVVTVMYVALIRTHGLGMTVTVSNVLAVLVATAVGIVCFGESMSARRAVGVLLLLTGLCMVTAA